MCALMNVTCVKMSHFKVTPHSNYCSSSPPKKLLTAAFQPDTGRTHTQITLSPFTLTQVHPRKCMCVRARGT